MKLKKKALALSFIASASISGTANSYVLPTLDLANIGSMIEDAILQGANIAENSMSAINTYNRYKTLVLQTTAIVKDGDFLGALRMYTSILGSEEINSIIKENLHLDANASVRLAGVVGRAFKYTPQTADGWNYSIQQVGGIVNSSRKRRLDTEQEEFKIHADQLRVLSRLYQDEEKRKLSSETLGSKIEALGASSELQTLQAMAGQNQLRFSQQEASTAMIRELVKLETNREIMKIARTQGEREQRVAYLATKHNQPQEAGGNNARKGFDTLLF